MDLNYNKRNKEQEAVRQAEIKKGLKHLGKLRMHKGHTLFEYNIATGELKKAEIEKETVILNGRSVTKNKVIVNENCQYIGFLNRETGIKKLKRHGLWIGGES